MPIASVRVARTPAPPMWSSDRTAWRRSWARISTFETTAPDIQMLTSRFYAPVQRRPCILHPVFGRRGGAAADHGPAYPAAGAAVPHGRGLGRRHAIRVHRVRRYAL